MRSVGNRRTFGGITFDRCETKNPRSGLTMKALPKPTLEGSSARDRMGLLFGPPIRRSHRKGIAENQGNGHKSKQKQRKTDGVEQGFHFEIVNDELRTSSIRSIKSW